MKLDPRLAEILERQPQKEQTLAEQRAQQNDFAASLRGKLTPEIPNSLELEDRMVPGRDRPIPVLIQRPEGLPDPTPVLVWAHGGAFVHGSPRTVLSRTASIAQRAGMCVVSVDYRLLPGADRHRTIDAHHISNATTADDARAQLGEDVAVYLDGGPAPAAQASTIVDVTGPVPRILRVGAVTTEQVAEVLDVDPASLLETR